MGVTNKPHNMVLLLIACLHFLRLIQCFPQSLVATGIGATKLTSEGEDEKKLQLKGKVLPLEITKFHVNSKIQFRYARTEVINEIKNPGTAPNKADFTMVIPDSAFISNFSMIIKGVEYVAEVKGKDDAKKTFDEAVSSGKGAGIVSKDTRDSNIFTVTSNIEPGEKVVFKLVYEELLERKLGKYKHLINIDPKQVVDDLKIEIFINESLPISSIFVPELVQSNEIDFTDNEESKIAKVEKNVGGIANNAKIVFAPDKTYQEEAGAQGISGQFTVKYDVDRKGEESEVQVIDGYFVHYFVPENLEILPKHVVFVLDVSGSMGGEKLEQLKDSMFTVLDDMTETDYFNIITFSSSVSHWRDPEDYLEQVFASEDVIPRDVNITQATKENKNLAIRYVLGLEAGGGTNINDAMLEGLKVAKYALQNEKLPQDVNSMIIFLTDGLPSSGETSSNAIKTNIKKANVKLETPIFSIGFGRYLDFTLIKDISEQANSFSKRIYEGSDAALQLEDFFAQISSPLISNLKFGYVGELGQNASISKTSLKTFFKGGEYIVAGKLDQSTKKGTESLTIKVVGDGKNGPYERDLQICLRSNNEQDQQVIPETEPRESLIPIIPPSLCIFPPNYPPRSLAQDFMQKLHAFIKIKQLIRKADVEDGEEASKLKEKALDLALDNNFVTDLTSLVVVRPDEKPTISSLEHPQTFGNIRLIAQGIGPSPVSRTRNRPPMNFIVGGGGGLRLGPNVQNILSRLTTRPPRRNILTRLTTPRPFITSTTTFSLYNDIAYDDLDYLQDYDENSTEIIECTGNLTFFSKTYLRGEKAVIQEEEADFDDISFDNLSVSASVSGSCCWQVFSELAFTGSSLVLSSQGTYTSVSSLGDLFRDVSSARKYKC